MNDGAFLDNLKECKKILKEYGILKKTNQKNIQLCTYRKYSHEFRTSMQKDEYVQAYIKGIELDDFDYMLDDGSYFQFSIDKTDENFILRMAFYPTIHSVSYNDFLHENLDMDIEQCGGTFLEDYQQYLSELETKFVTPIRYDYNSKIFKPLVHSASHVHFGYEENIRIPVDNILFPSAFVKIILQYYYYDNWKEEVMQEDTRNCFITKSEKKMLDEAYFGVQEKKIPYISI